MAKKKTKTTKLEGTDPRSLNAMEIFFPPIALG